MTAKTTTKRGRGRPRKAPAPTGASLREAAAHFGVARKTLLRWVGEGMDGISRNNERVYVDLEAAQAWVDARADEGPRIPVAKLLHPSDPRHRMSVAMGRVRRLEFHISTGRAVTVEDIRARFAPALVELSGRLKTIHTQVAEVTAANAAEKLAPVIEDASDGFRFDDPAEWPTPMQLDDDEEPTEDLGLEFESNSSIEYMPVLQSNDARYEDAVVKGMKAEARLAELLSSTVYVPDALKVATRLAENIRYVVRLIPQWVADALRDGGDADRIIQDKVELARILIRGPEPEAPHADAIAAVCGGKNFPSVIQLLHDAVVTDDDEFEPRNTADFASVLRALEKYPAVQTGAEFG